MTYIQDQPGLPYRREEPITPFVKGFLLVSFSAFLFFVQGYGWSHIDTDWGKAALICTCSVIVPVLSLAVAIQGIRMIGDNFNRL